MDVYCESDSILGVLEESVNASRGAELIQRLVVCDECHCLKSGRILLMFLVFPNNLSEEPANCCYLFLDFFFLFPFSFSVKPVQVFAMALPSLYKTEPSMEMTFLLVFVFNVQFLQLSVSVGVISTYMFQSRKENLHCLIFLSLVSHHFQISVQGENGS